MAEPDDTERRPMEAALMAALDRMAMEVDVAMALVQDDGRMSGPVDRAGILKSMFLVEARVREVRDILRPSGSYSSVRLDGDADT